MTSDNKTESGNRENRITSRTGWTSSRSEVIWSYGVLKSRTKSVGPKGERNGVRGGQGNRE